MTAGEQKTFIVPANATFKTITVTDSVFGANVITIYEWPGCRIQLQGAVWPVASSTYAPTPVASSMPGWMKLR